MKGLKSRISPGIRIYTEKEFYRVNDLYKEGEFNATGDVEFAGDDDCDSIGFSFNNFDSNYNYIDNDWDSISIELIPFLSILHSEGYLFDYIVGFYSFDKKIHLQFTSVDELDSLDNNEDFISGGRKLRFMWINVSKTNI
jgi:hypothetical protein